MHKFSTYLTILLLSSLSPAHAVGTVWHPVTSGCYENSIYESLSSWHDAPFSSSSLRFATVPDTGRGPAVLIVLDKGLNHALVANGEPIVIAAVGDSRRTCVHRMPMSACESAQGARQQLAALQPPLLQDLDAGFVLRLHATQYRLQWRDGSAVANAVAYTDPSHPVSAAVSQAIGDMQSCWSPAMAAWQDAR